MRRLAVLLALVPVLCGSFAAKADNTAQTAIAMYGEPVTKSDFTHFDYVNPDAPKGGKLKLAATGTFDSLNPFIIISQPPAGLVSPFPSLVYQPLMSRNQNEPFTLHGLIAESVEVPDDRSSITFHVRSSARWQDGQPITADDVLFSYNILRENGRPHMRLYYKKIARAEKLDPLTVKFTFAPNPDHSINREMPLIMGLMPILPEHDWKNRDFNKTTWQIPIGSGPYKITAVDPGRSITYTRDPHYWGRDLPVQKGLYNFDEIHIDYYRDDNIALEAFKANAYDLRRESDAKKWASGYEGPALQDGRLKLENAAYYSVEPAKGFILNTRRDVLREPVLRAALQYAFDFEWINKTLFYGQYKRVTSFFPNSELAAPSLPQGRELEILESYRAQLPATIFTEPVTPPPSSEDDMRDNLLTASAMLKKAGYTLRDNHLYAPQSNAPMQFEILLNNPADEKVALEWRRVLSRLGIDARVHTADSAQFEKRINSFDFDIIIGQWINSMSPGNEQINYWGSAAADQPGSRNYPGIKDPVVDALAAAIPAAHSREDLVATVHALDRVLMAGHYMVPLYYSGSDRIAYWTAHLHHPEVKPLYGSVLESWWYQ